MNITRFDNVQAIAEGRDKIQVEVNGEDVWVPRAQIHPSSEVQEAPDKGTLIVNTFWARKANLIT